MRPTRIGLDRFIVFLFRASFRFGALETKMAEGQSARSIVRLQQSEKKVWKKV
jgi:hypothetical protein